MKFFFDTEFIENGSTVIPLSIGIVDEDGREFYREWERTPAELSTANEWVVANVFPHLRATQGDLRWISPNDRIRAEVVRFVGYKPEFWAWYASYDWMVMCQMFGNMTDLPVDWPMFVMDLRAFAHRDFPGAKSIAWPERKLGPAHDALADAMYLKVQYEHYDEMVRLAAERERRSLFPDPRAPQFRSMKSAD